MKNDYQASDLIIVDGIEGFVLGSKAWVLLQMDAVLGWGYGTVMWFDDIDEDES